MKKLALLIPTLLISSLTGCSTKFNPEENNTENDPSLNGASFEITFDKDVHLDAGNITQQNVSFHFDERSVNEIPSDPDVFVEIGPHGALYLENYIPGLTEVSVTAKHTTDYEGEFFLGRSSTPNNIEYFSLYSMTSSFISINSDQPYFAIFNRGDNNLLLEKIVISGEHINPETGLKNKIKVNDLQSAYNANEVIKPYDIFPINDSDIPSNRIVKKIGPDEYKEPGQYIFGYEVYNKTKYGEQGKMLYSSLAHLTIKGTEDYNHLAIFHLKDNNVIIPVANHGKVDISQYPALATYNWNNQYNDITSTFYRDRDFYPTFSVVGMPVNKNGDGCMPVATTYCTVNKSFHMPDPVMDDGYKFGGWFLDRELSKPFDEDGEYFGNLNLYAKCIETEDNFRKVYYHDYDGTLIDRVDYLYDNQSLVLPTFSDIPTKSGTNKLMYAVVIGSNRLDMLRPKGNYPMQGYYNGDTLDYDLIKDIAGDIHLYISEFENYDSGPSQFTRFFEDGDKNMVASGFKMKEAYQEGDLILPGRYVEYTKPSYEYDYKTYTDVARTDQFAITDEIHGYLMDQSSYNSIATYGYANKYHMHAKPLEGILRHESVLKVGRRAFFNRYGLKGTYFPRNAKEFDIEAYANTEFNGNVFLPKTLTTIGKGAFLGSSNIKVVALPKTLKKVGANAFSTGTFDEKISEFKDIQNRNVLEQIIFLYEGSETDFNKLDEASRLEIENNAAKIIYNVDYHPYYGR